MEITSKTHLSLLDYVMENLDACVISKASSDLDEQRDIRAAVNATT